MSPPIEKKSLAKIKEKIEASKTFPRSPIGFMKKKGYYTTNYIKPPKQKNSCSFNNFYINNYKYEGLCKDFGDLKIYTLYFVFIPILEKRID